VAPAVRQQRPPKWPRDPHALRRPAPGLRPLASAAFGQGDRLGILRVQGALVILVHVVLNLVLHDNLYGSLYDSFNRIRHYLKNIPAPSLAPAISTGSLRQAWRPVNKKKIVL
jgi:hypothetical protein